MRNHGLRAIVMACVFAPLSVATAPNASTERSFTVYFDYEQSGLHQGLVIVRQAVDYGGVNARYSVTGYSVEDERDGVARRRADSIRIALHTMGVPGDRISMEADSYPAREISNVERRATILVRR